MERLLFVDDDIEILSLNRSYFTEHGYDVDTASSAEEAMELLKDRSYDCLVLDIKMEAQDGFELCNNLRKTTNTPVIFLTVLTDSESLVKGFNSGADDYVEKPYRLQELEMRIRARISPHIPSSYEQKHPAPPVLSLYPEEQQAYIGTQSLKLTANEFQILYFLSQHKGIPYRQEEIYQALWGENYNTHSIQVLILRIRKKIQAAAPDKEFIRTQWGNGYVYTES